MDGSPSGLQVNFSVVSGDAIIKDISDNTTGIYYTFNQPFDNEQLFSSSNIQITSTGTSRFMLELHSTNVYRNPTTHNLVLLQCHNNEVSPNEVETYAYVSLTKDEPSDNSLLVSIGNQKRMHY